VGEDAAGEEAAQLGLDEGGYARAVAVRAGGLQELLEVVAHDAVQHRGRAGAGAVSGRRREHVRRRCAPRADSTPDAPGRSPARAKRNVAGRVSRLDELRG
jgi:hypothetical protein